MKIKSIFYTLAIGILIFTLISYSPLAASYATSTGNGGSNSGKAKVRVITETDEKAAAALDQGCNIVRETKGLKALVCTSDVASALGLPEDIRMFAVDAGANSQISASAVQDSGNNGTGRKLVVLDTGYNYGHVELNSSFLGGIDFVNDDNDPADDNGHGSHVAGLITADGILSNARGVAPGAGIIAGKVLDSSGSGFFSDVVAGIYWAVDGPDGVSGTGDDFNADAISISIGSSSPYVYKGYCDSVMPSMTNAIKYAVSKGVMVVVAAGNSGSAGVSIPGCISYSTTVGAVKKSDSIASFSGRGKAVDITAPGVSLVSSWIGGESTYATASGTSMATPIISATVALIKHDHPSYSPSQVEGALFKTAKDLGKAGKDTSYGYGRVVASAAVAG
jgi:subtilisin family serine protease